MGRAIGLGVASLIVFAAVAGIMLKFMPVPLRDSDYLLAGTVATLAAMLALFVLLIATSRNKANIFFKRRKKS
jgi:hypothetical protein